MKLGKWVGVLVIVGLVVVAYYSTIGWAEPVPDFEPEVPDEPDTPDVPVEPEPGVPIAYATFTYDFTVLTPYTGKILSIVPSIHPYISPSEGRIYINQKLSFNPWPPTLNGSASVFIHIDVMGKDLKVDWQSDASIVMKYPTEMTGESGRVFFTSAGTYTWACMVIADSGIAGDSRTIGFLQGSFEVAV